jgi:hypothetical protein
MLASLPSMDLESETWSLGNPDSAKKQPLGSGYAVQVASGRVEREAQAAFRVLQAKYPNQLGGRQATTRRADLGARGIYYRACGPLCIGRKGREVVPRTGSCRRRLHHRKKLTFAGSCPDGAAAEARAMRGMEGDAVKSTLHKERATKNPQSRKWFLGPGQAGVR